MKNNKDFNSNPNGEGFNIIVTDKGYKSHRFKKKKHGIAGFFQKIGNWWSDLKRWKRRLIKVLTVIIVILLVLAITFLSLFNYNYNKITTNPEELGFENIIDQKIVNIALFGIDTRSKSSFKGNSDSIMVLSINTETNAVKIVSIMRDSLVEINDGEKTYYNKINSAYGSASGGPELAIKTLNHNFGLDISEYATVNFYGMAEIIDAVGGIDVEFTRQEVVTNHADGFNGLVKRHCEKIGVDPEPYYIRTEGKHHVNGIQAVAYSRIRKYENIWGTNNDFGRTDRQRYVMEQLFEKAIKLPKSRYVNLVKALIPYTETSLSYSEIMGLAFDVLLDSPTFEQTRMPLNEYQMKAPNIPRVGSTVYYDLEFAKDLLHEFFYNNVNPEAYVEQNGIAKNDWYAALK
ncbi:MAG: LCP family protein [Clostridia bacterium]|nr:LCP family protein [Clostridia bacterium]